MLIPIPVGTNHTAIVRGAVWKLVTCTHCQQQYAYRLELEAIGQDLDLLFLDSTGSAERARVRAEHNLVQMSRNCVLPVPCPVCGFYQDEMARLLKAEAEVNEIQVAGAVLALASFVPLCFDEPYMWVLTLVLGLAGLALLALGYVVAFRFDPNAGDPEPRKALGQRDAVWGERLAQLLAARSPAEARPTPDPAT